MDLLRLVIEYSEPSVVFRIEQVNKKLYDSMNQYWFEKYNEINYEGKKIIHKCTSCYFWYYFERKFPGLHFVQLYEILTNKNHPSYEEAKTIFEKHECDHREHYEYQSEFKNENYRHLYFICRMKNELYDLKQKNLGNRITFCDYVIKRINESNLSYQNQIETLLSVIDSKEKEKLDYVTKKVDYEKEQKKLNQIEQFLEDEYRKNQKCIYLITKGKNKDQYCGKNTKMNNDFCSKHKK